MSRCGTLEYICPICPELWNIYVPCVPSCGTYLSHLSQVVEVLFQVSFKFYDITSSYIQVLFIHFKLISSCTFSFQVLYLYFKFHLFVSSCFSIFLSLYGRDVVKYNIIQLQTEAHSLNLRKIRKSSGQKVLESLFYFLFCFHFSY